MHPHNRSSRTCVTVFNMCDIVGAFGYLEVTDDITQYCKASVFSKVGKRTRAFVRFSTVGECYLLRVWKMDSVKGRVEGLGRQEKLPARLCLYPLPSLSPSPPSFPPSLRQVAKVVAPTPPGTPVGSP